MASMTAAQINVIKSRLKAELARRNGFGSVSGYSQSGYDFTKIPVQGEVILAEHGQKTIDLLLKIASLGDLKAVASGEPIPNSFTYEKIIDLLSVLEKESKTGTASETSSCGTNCTGLCVGSCQGMCNGCTDTCSGACWTSCAAGVRSEQ